MRQLDVLENTALTMLCQDIDPGARALAERAQEIFSHQDAQSAFRWLEAALKLDAKVVLSDTGFRELLDAYFDLQSKKQRFESLLVQAEARLARDPSSSDGLAAAEDLLNEAKVVGGQLGATDRMEEIEEKRTSLRQLHREALIEQLGTLLQRLEDMWQSQQASSQQMAEALSALKDLAHILAKIEKAQLAVQNVKPHLQRAFEYYTRLRSEKELEGDKHCIEGYSLSYMLLSKVSGWETG
jgi:DNA repair exonuclease SbcCD ATPase subunit